MLPTAYDITNKVVLHEEAGRGSAKDTGSRCSWMAG